MNQSFDIFGLELGGAYLVTPFAAEDLRGEFIKDYSESFFESKGIHFPLREVFYTRSHRGVIRALHFQRVKQQPKLVRCVSGLVYDVIVDLRKDSHSFGKWLGFELSGNNCRELLIPAGFGHGYLVIEDAIVSYKCAERFYSEYDDGILWNDPEIGIKWPLELIGGVDNIILSKKDMQLQTFNEFRQRENI